MIANENVFLRFLRRNALALVCTAGLFLLMYEMVLSFRFGSYMGYGFSTGDSDYIDHMVWALAITPQQMLSSFYDGSDYLWHICVKLLFLAGVSNTWKAAAVVTAAADAIAYLLVYKTWECVLPEKFPRWLAALLTAAVFVAHALVVPGGSMYIGVGAVNTWHNPTNIMVRPFAAAVFYMTVRIYNRRRYDSHAVVCPSQDGRSFAFTGSFWAQFRQPVYTWPELILYPVCILFSAYAKPSFLQFFAPTILLFLAYDVIRTKGRLLPFCLKLALAYIPAGLILLTQFTSVFDGGVTVTAAATATATATTAADAAAAAAETTASADGVAIYFIQQSFTGIGEFIRQSALEFVTTVALCAFPLFIFFADWNNSRHDTAFRLSLLGMIVARLESLLLHETGSRASHGNFYWGYYLAVWLFWTVAMGRYLLLWQDTSPRGKIIRYVGLGLFGLHLAAGVMYIVHIFQTGVYYY